LADDLEPVSEESESGARLDGREHVASRSGTRNATMGSRAPESDDVTSRVGPNDSIRSFVGSPKGGSASAADSMIGVVDDGSHPAKIIVDLYGNVI
jgi:hypothetical protein